jgi:hypothetical protein
MRADQGFRALLNRMQREVTVQRQIAEEKGLLDVDDLMIPKG